MAVSASTVADAAGAIATSAETVCSAVLLSVVNGVRVRQAAFSGVVSAHSGSRTSPSRPDQPPPYADANPE